MQERRKVGRFRLLLHSHDCLLRDTKADVRSRGGRDVPAASVNSLAYAGDAPTVAVEHRRDDAIADALHHARRVQLYFIYR